MVMRIKKRKGKDITRRQWLKTSGMGLDGLALGRTMIGCGGGSAKAQQACPNNACGYPTSASTAAYNYAADLVSSGAIYTPDMKTDLDSDEMRITFLGSAFPQTYRSQQMMSIFVEVGPWIKKTSITQLIGMVSNYTFGPPRDFYSPLNPPKYFTPTAQPDQANLIEPGNSAYCENGY